MPIVPSAKSALEILTTQLVAVASVALLWTLLGSRPTGPEPVEDVEFTLDASRLTNMVGSGDAVIVEFTDFECPVCANPATETFPRIKRELIDEGLVRYVALNFPLARIHPHARQAAKIALCAGRAGRYWEMHEALFQLAARLDEGRLAEQIKSTGLHSAAMDKCLIDDTVSAEVRADVMEGYRLGVSGTPTFFLGTVHRNGSVALKKRFGRQPSVEELRAEVQDLVANGVEPVEGRAWPRGLGRVRETPPEASQYHDFC
jgi:protein-disulfide isomerase